ncbi:MAG TPA: hypothetical protein DCX07_05135 [Phycisphaerales bacterium]|nr:hypothetical protein [Phycisphaerales bacterium]
MTAWFYILRLESGVLYPGATTNLDQRWRGHQSGHACRTTKLDPPVGLVLSEPFEIFSEARRREGQVKRWSAKKKEALVSGDFVSLRTLAVSHDHGRRMPNAVRVT